MPRSLARHAVLPQGEPAAGPVPERGGALYKFLNTMQPGMNISLFHYRNYGGDVARILAGIQCKKEEYGELEKFLKDIGYPWKDVTNSDSYKLFLRN